MFTGLVEEEGVVAKSERRRGSVIFTFHAVQTARGLKADESVSVNGVCLTVIGSTRTTFTMQAVEQTLKKTNLGRLKVGDMVNLERALLPNDRLSATRTVHCHFAVGPSFKIVRNAQMKIFESNPSSTNLWADTFVLFEKKNVFPGLAKNARRGEPSGPGTDNDDVVGFHSDVDDEKERRYRSGSD